MTVKSKTINFIFVLDLIFIDGFVCCLISIRCREQVQQYYSNLQKVTDEWTRGELISIKHSNV